MRLQNNDDAISAGNPIRTGGQEMTKVAKVANSFSIPRGRFGRQNGSFQVEFIQFGRSALQIGTSPIPVRILSPTAGPNVREVSLHRHELVFCIGRATTAPGVARLARGGRAGRRGDDVLYCREL